jgi:uncharacterized protein YecA (UPF0149 family)
MEKYEKISKQNNKTTSKIEDIIEILEENEEEQEELRKANSSFGAVINKNKNIGRNDPCPCGSGKKYKKCCGA